LRCQELLRRFKESLDRRGPDAQRQVDLKVTLAADKVLHLTFYSTVLWLQGSRPQLQPLEDPNGNWLLWNGDVFKEENAAVDDGEVEEKGQISDTMWLGQRLRTARDHREVAERLATVRGPRAFVYYRKTCQTVFFGKDFFGRHSLLKSASNQHLLFTSVGPNHHDHPTITSHAEELTTCDELEEVDARGVYKIDLRKYLGESDHSASLQVYPWDREMPNSIISQTESSSASLSNGASMDEDSNSHHLPCLPDVINPSRLNCDLEKSVFGLPASNDSSSDVFEHLLKDPEFDRLVSELTDCLEKSVRTRVNHQPGLCKDCVELRINAAAASSKNEEKVECDCCKVGVLFSGGLDSAVIAALARKVMPPEETIDLINVAFQQSDGTFDQVPDRITGQVAFQEIRNMFPDNSRNLRFVSVDVTKEELVCERQKRVKSLLFPLQTVLDDSIGCAVWFAARGRGSCGYASPCRVLLLGMGADEQFGGYSRHRGRYNREGMAGLLDEIRLEMSRISERNLGRDNRIVSDHGVAGRYPFLDEGVVSFLNGLKLGQKMDLELERGVGEKLLLRGVAYKLGMPKTALNPKRAIQFGSRIAKLENRKEKATDVALR